MGAANTPASFPVPRIRAGYQTRSPGQSDWLGAGGWVQREGRGVKDAGAGLRAPNIKRENRQT